MIDACLADFVSNSKRNGKKKFSLAKSLCYKETLIRLLKREFKFNVFGVLKGKVPHLPHKMQFCCTHTTSPE
jgi:hypothetical protein